MLHLTSNLKLMSKYPLFIVLTLLVTSFWPSCITPIEEPPQTDFLEFAAHQIHLDVFIPDLEDQVLDIGAQLEQDPNNVELNQLFFQLSGQLDDAFAWQNMNAEAIGNTPEVELPIPCPDEIVGIKGCVDYPLETERVVFAPGVNIFNFEIINEANELAFILDGDIIELNDGSQAVKLTQVGEFKTGEVGILKVEKGSIEDTTTYEMVARGA